MIKNQAFEIPGKVKISTDLNGLAKVIVTTASSTAEVYLEGAHITSFQRQGEEDLLFMSDSGKIPRGKMLHGGIPLCFPWFADRQGEKLAHGVARVNTWKLIRTEVISLKEVKLIFQLPPSILQEAGWTPVDVYYTIIIGEKLTLEFYVHNTSKKPFSFEECLHTYFRVGDVRQATIHGLQGETFLDKTDGFISKIEKHNHIPITEEINRVYLKSKGTLKIHDASLQRTICIEKSNSHSTVVWNPWSEKGKLIPDFAPNDYQKMLCVESGNVKEEAITLAAGESSSFQVILSIEKMKNKFHEVSKIY